MRANKDLKVVAATTMLTRKEYEAMKKEATAQLRTVSTFIRTLILAELNKEKAQ